MTPLTPSARIKAAMPERLAQVRKAKGLTQEELGKAIGYSKQAIYNCERGSHVPCTELLFLLAEFLDCRMDFLCGRDIS